MCNLDTNKSPDDFENIEEYYEYCEQVAKHLYQLFVKKMMGTKRDGDHIEPRRLKNKYEE